MMKRSEGGFSLVELVLVASAVIFVGLLIMSLPSAISSIDRSRHASIAKEVANRRLEELRKVSYANLANGTNVFNDADLGSLNQSSAHYEIEDCPATICTDPGVYRIKQVKVRVLWNESGDNKKVELATLVGEGGLGQ